MTKLHKTKWAMIMLSTFGGLTIVAPSALSITFIGSIFSFDQKTEAEIEDEKQWKDAQSVLANFYMNLRFEHFEKARSYLTPDYAGNVENYSMQKLNEAAVRRKGDIRMINLIRDTASSSEQRKVFSYDAQFILKADNKVHGEHLRAFIVLRDGVWTIDTIRDEGSY